MSGFYNKVMSIPLKPGKVLPPLKKKAAPKKKGKTAKAKGIKVRPKIKSLDVFKVVMEADAGGESKERQEEFFELHLKELSRSQLDKMMKRIQRIAGRT